MALINTLRNKMGKFVIGAIMFTLLAFILTDLIGKSSLFGGKEPDLAEIAGTDISNQEFQAKVQQLTQTYAINTNRNPTQQESKLIQDQAWNALILERVYEPQFKELGLTVTKSEMNDLVYGKNISPLTKQYFTNPQTGVFDKEVVIKYAENIASPEAPVQQKISWNNFLSSLKISRVVEKYNKLLAASNFVNKHEAKNAYYGKESNADISYVYVPFMSLADSSISVTDGELKSYIRSHENEYQREESRDIDYVLFNVTPSSSDSLLLKKEMDGLYQDFLVAKNDSVFASLNSDDAFLFATYNSETMPEDLKAMEVGQISRPKVVTGSYEIAKISRKEFPDSTKMDSAVFKVAKIRKNFFTSDETVNGVYREADQFASSINNIDDFTAKAKEKNYNVMTQRSLLSTSQRIGFLPEARTVVFWLFNEASKGDVSKVKEVGDYYVVAAMKDIQEKGLAKLELVKNEVAMKVRNQKKATIIMDKLKTLDAKDLDKLSSGYGSNARKGTASFKLNAQNVSGIGVAPELVGLVGSLNEDEVSAPIAVEGGVVVAKLDSKTVPSEKENYDSEANQAMMSMYNPPVTIADFPLSYFRLTVPKKVDDAIKEFAEIEDQRHKFF